MINNSVMGQLGRLKTQMNRDNLITNMDVVIDFFKKATPYDFDRFIAKANDDSLFERVRTHVFVLKLNQDDYLDELAKNTKAFNTFAKDMDRASSVILACEISNNDSIIENDYE